MAQYVHRYDASMLNGLQAVGSWVTCNRCWLCNCMFKLTLSSVYNNPRSALLGLMSAMYSLGAICALPMVPFITDTLGRRHAIIFGSIMMLIGATLQTASQNCSHNIPMRSMATSDNVFMCFPVAMFVIARFILGLGIPFAIVAASSLIGGKRISILFSTTLTYSGPELSHPKERAILGSLFNSCYFIGR